MKFPCSTNTLLLAIVTTLTTAAAIQAFCPFQTMRRLKLKLRPSIITPKTKYSHLCKVAALSTSSSSSSSSSSNRNRNGMEMDASSVQVVPSLSRHPPRKVCFMIEPTPFTHVSGYANRFQELLKFLHKAKDNVNILTVDSQTPTAKLPKTFLSYPIGHTQGFTFPLYNHISLSVDLPEMKGAKMIEQFQPDLIHVTSPGFMLFAAIVYARVMCVPLVMSYHTHLPSYGKNYLGFVPYVEEICWELMRWAHSRADLTLVTSSQMKDELVRKGIPRVDVWRKGIDVERFHPQFKSVEMRNRMSNGHAEDFIMVYVGRLGAEKRLKDIRDMLEHMPIHRTRLAIVGTGPQEQELHAYFAGTNTVFLGQLRGDALSSAFASADCFIMPSDSETLGFVVLESMASGVPVVAANAGGIPDIIVPGKTGFLIAPGDTQAYVEKLLLLQNDAKLRKRMGKSSRKEAERWGWEAATSYLRNIQYERAIINFHSRAFSGWGKPRTAAMFRLLIWRGRSFSKKLKLSSISPKAAAVLSFSVWRRAIVTTPKAVLSSVWRRFRFQFRRRGDTQQLLQYRSSGDSQAATSLGTS